MQNKWQELYDKALQAGREAAKACTPTPMVVQQHANMMDDNSPVVKQWHVPDGVCGFAWVKIRPGNCPFANWLKKNKLGSKAYRGGVEIWISEYNQSMTKKETHAQAMSAVLREAGIDAWAESRMD